MHDPESNVLDDIRLLFKSIVPAVDFCSLRVVDETTDQMTVRQDVLQPVTSNIDRGAMVIETNNPEVARIGRQYTKRTMPV